MFQRDLGCKVEIRYIIGQTDYLAYCERRRNNFGGVGRRRSGCADEISRKSESV